MDMRDLQINVASDIWPKVLLLSKIYLSTLNLVLYIRIFEFYLGLVRIFRAE